MFDKNFHIHYIGVRERKDGKIKKKAKIKLSTLVFFTVIYMYLVVLIVYTKFEDCSTHRYRADKIAKLLERKKNGQIKGLISHMRLIL